MPKVPDSVTKESYLLRSTFFYNRLCSEGYFSLFNQLKRYARIEGENLDWDNRGAWSISDEAWSIVLEKKIAPVLLFLHPKVLLQNPTFLKYYRSIAMLPQKGLKAMSGISNLNNIEDGKIEAGKLSQKQIAALACSINGTVSALVSLAADFSEKNIEGMMYASAGAKIDGSWRNSIGAEGERVIRSIIFNELLLHNDISSIIEKNNNLTAISEWTKDSEIEKIKIINLTNGYSILFSSEPDITMYDTNGNIVGAIEIKSGLDPAGALERLGAMLKSFENTLAEYPDAVTILVASCITEEMENRIGASMLVHQKYLTISITNNEHEKRKFVNRLRTIMNLINTNPKITPTQNENHQRT